MSESSFREIIDRGVEKLKAHYNPSKINLNVNPKYMQGIRGSCWHGDYINIRGNLNDEEKVETVIHELLHLAKGHCPLLNLDLNLKENREGIIYQNARLNCTVHILAKHKEAMEKKFGSRLYEDPIMTYARCENLREENEIEAETQVVYAECPDFVRYLEHTLGLRKYEDIEKIIDEERGQLRLFD